MANVDVIFRFLSLLLLHLVDCKNADSRESSEDFTGINTVNETLHEHSGIPLSYINLMRFGIPGFLLGLALTCCCTAQGYACLKRKKQQTENKDEEQGQKPQFIIYPPEYISAEPPPYTEEPSTGIRTISLSVQKNEEKLNT